MLLHEISRLGDNFLRVTDNGGVVGMLLSKFIEYCGRYFVFICECFVICVWKIFFVKWERRFVDGCLRLLQVGLRALHDFLHRQIGGECEPQFLSKLLPAESKITVGSWQKIFLQPLFVIL